MFMVVLSALKYSMMLQEQFLSPQLTAMIGCQPFGILIPLSQGKIIYNCFIKTKHI